jgi:hypothetical protein
MYVRLFIHSACYGDRVTARQGQEQRERKRERDREGEGERERD